MSTSREQRKQICVLVVGGAGYIGSHMTRELCEANYRVLVLDNLQAGYRDAVSEKAEFIYGNMADRTLLAQIFSKNNINCVIHMASDIQVGESVSNPIKYYQNNVSNTLILLEQMVSHGVMNFVFSSSAAVFGNPEYVPIDELHPKIPLSPYGQSKLMVEQILTDYEIAYGLHSVSLRYFNAAGAHPDGTLGERHIPETHLIPLVLQAASGRRDAITVFGDGYPTPDGTCIRDYIHVIDLCSAHLQAIKYLETNKQSAAFNLGNGIGFSVRQVIDAAYRITAREIPTIYSERRKGDPAILIADSALACEQLGWEPEFSKLEIIVRHAWEWEKQADRWAVI